MARAYQREAVKAPSTKRDPLIVVPLKHGGTDGGEPIDALHIMRRINVGDLEAADDSKSQIGKVVILASRLSGLSVREIRELDAEDLGAVSEAVASLLGGGEAGEDGATFP